MTHPYMRSRSMGFTLIELVIVMVVVAVLAAIAIPSYQSQIRKSRRTDAKTAVLDLAAREEKYLSLNNSYTNSIVFLGYAPVGSPLVFPQPVGSGYYTINVCVAGAPAGCPASAAATGSAYVVYAIPNAGSSQLQDTSCQYFSVDNTGTQFASSTQAGGPDTTSTCWQ